MEQQQALNKDAAQDGENPVPAKITKRKITFEDYENFLDKLEREGKLDAIASSNPKVTLQNSN